MWKCNTWDLVRALQSASPDFCMTPATFIDSICPNNQPRKNKESKNEIQIPTNHIALPWLAYTEHRAKRCRLGTQSKRGSDKINMQKQGRNTQKKASRIVQPGLTDGCQHLER